MPLDSQLDSREEFYARAYKAPVEEELKVEEEQVSLPGAIVLFVTGSLHSILGGFLTYSLAEMIIEEKAEPQHIANGFLASALVLGGAYYLKHAYVGFQGILSQSRGVAQ